MNKLLRTPISSKIQRVLPPGARRTVEYACAPSGQHHPGISTARTSSPRARWGTTGRCGAAVVSLVALLALASNGWGENLNPALGERLTAAEIDALAKIILPDGTGLPAGSGTAVDGGELYVVHCQACHGAGGTGGINGPLVGGQGSLSGPAPLLTVGSYWPYATTLFDYARRAMPYGSPGSLSDDQVYAVTAYVLFLNGIVALNSELDARTLPGVRMPNADGFFSAYPQHPPPSKPR